MNSRYYLKLKRYVIMSAVYVMFVYCSRFLGLCPARRLRQRHTLNPCKHVFPDKWYLYGCISYQPTKKHAVTFTILEVKTTVLPTPLA